MLTIAQLYDVLSPVWTLSLIAAIMVPYIVVTAVAPDTIRKAAAFLGMSATVGMTVREANRDAKNPRRPSYADILDVLPTLVCIVLASVGLVRSALVLGSVWNISMQVLGTIVLASLTGIPNVVTAVQLARRGRGSAVLSESLNSNTLNLIVGISLPSLFFRSIPLNSQSMLALWWLVGMTLLALGLSFGRDGLGRRGGALLVIVYVVFLVAIIRR